MTTILKPRKTAAIGGGIRAIDLFCGAGGLTFGLQKTGINVCLGVDIDPACEYPYTANNESKFLLKSVEEIRADDLATYYASGKIRLLAGCAPCQTFSKYNQKATSEDERWWLLLHFSRLVRELSPEIVTMENVPGLQKQDVFKKFVSTLKRNGYRVYYQIVECEKYGIPQTRHRLVLLASKLGQISLLSPEDFGSKCVTVRDRIGDLPPLKAGEKDEEDPMHKSAALSKTNLKRIRASRPGGTWKDWRKSLVAKCHRKKQGMTYPGVYGRMKWDEPSPTITTQFHGFGNGRFGHPEQDRAISLREGAILQTFPKNYKFVPSGEPVIKKYVSRLIGNAVPVRLGEVIGKSIVKHVANASKRSRQLVRSIHATD